MAFLSDYDDYQARSAVINPDFTTTLRLNNVGKLRTKGIETDISLQATESLRFDASVAWVDAVIEEFDNATCYPGQTAADGCDIPIGTPPRLTQDLGGEDLANSPDLKVNLGADFNHAIEGMPFDVFAQLNYQWQDDVVFDLFRDPLTAQGSYGVANLSLGIVEREEERYRVTFFVDNLADEDYAVNLTNSGNLYGGKLAVTKQWARNSERYMGLRVKFAF